MAQSTSVFITATEARQNPRREIVVHAEARGIESEILNAVSLGYYEVNVTNNTPMTNSSTVISDVWTVNTSTNQLYIPSHGFSNGDSVTVSSTIALPSPLVTGTYYYIIYIDEDHVKLATTFANSVSGQPIHISITSSVTAITLTDSGSGYIQAPIVNISNGSPSSNATAISYLSTWGNVISIANSTAGSGYSDLPTVDISSLGSGATAGAISYLAISVSIAAAGATYHQDDILSVVGGTGTAITARVTAVDSSGAILAITLVNAGAYTVFPDTTAAATTVLPGGGTGCTLNLTMGIRSIAVASGGSGYVAAPRVLISSSTGSGAAASATIYGGQVSEIIVTSAGSSYLNVSSITMDTGSGATGVAMLQQTSVESATLTYGGGNTYTAPPTVTIAPFGSGAVAGAVALTVVNLQLVSGGAGYVSGDSLLISGGTASVNAWIKVVTVSSTGAILTYVLENGGSYTALPGLVANPVNGGTGTLAAFNLTMGLSSIVTATAGSTYRVPPIVTIDAPDGDSPIQATASAMLVTGNVSNIMITNAGSAYTNIPNVAITNGKDATASSYLTPTTINSIAITNAGSGYTTANISITGGGASTNATGTVNLNSGSIATISITNAGVGYTTLPTVTITGDGINGAGYAVLTATSVAGLNILNNGAGYNAPPAIIITGAATANAVVTETGIDRIVVTNQGHNYVAAPDVYLIPGTYQGSTPSSPTLTSQLAYSVSSIVITNAGVNYLSAPTITLAPPYYPTGNIATATSSIGAGAGTFGLTPYNPSRDYYKAWKNQQLSNTQLTRPYTERMDTIISYFTNMGYTINRVTNPSSSNTFMWNVRW